MRTFARAGVLALAMMLSSGCSNGAGQAGGETALADPARQDPAAQTSEPRLGLVTSLPIYWTGASGVADILSAQGEVHWVRQDLERAYVLVPLDTLAAQGEGGTIEPSAGLAGLKRLFVAQPRALSPADNVALDEWVRGGGSLLFVIDPMLTEHSEFGIGDPRRPTDVGLVPPVFARWGLAMTYEPSPDGNPSTFDLDDTEIVAFEYGELAVRDASGPASRCEILAQGLVAACTIGKGRAVIVADASFLEPDEEPVEDRTALQALLALAFDTN